jgi:transcription-repair coupling factor (superfamily II helicase)
MPHLRSLLQPVIDNPSFRAAASAVSAGNREAVLSGLTRPAKALIVAGLAHELRRTVVVLTSDNEAADRLEEPAATALEWLEPGAGASVSVMPAWDGSPYEGRSPHAEIAERRAVALWNLARGLTRILFVPLPAALVRLRESSFYAWLAPELKVGDELNLDELIRHLVSVGYEAGEPVENVGQYSVRGGIVDVFSPESDWPLRVEFFGDRIESLRQFDATTQRSRKPAASALLLPLAERKTSPKFFESLIQALRARTPKGRAGEREPEWAAAYSGPFPGWEYFAPLVEPHPSTLLSLVSQPLLVWDERMERKEQLKRTLEGWGAAYDEVRDTVPPRPRPEDIFLTETEFLESIESIPQLALKELVIEGSGPRELILRTQPAPKLHGDVKGLIENLRARLANQETLVFVLPTSGKVDRVREILSEYEIPFANVSDEGAKQGNSSIGSGAVLMARGELGEGVVFPESGLAFLTDSDLFGSFDWGVRGRREKSGISSFISSLGDLKQGDYVVHVDHGIGIYRGLRQLEVDGARRDFMLLTYQDEAKLYVPLERLDLVEKYRSGGDGAKPQLDRLGGGTWERTKTRVKRALRDMAQELLQLYAERRMRGGIAFSADSPWQKEFEDAFPFEETPDQLTALAEIKHDLESPAPMDRLLCGDVGYGKTELAMRAALKVVQDSKSVAILAPTTVLAFQHFTTFRQRIAPFPVRVEMLSRFRSPAEQKKILADTEAGKVDILIGTHRLLSKDVHFRDLGLLVIDEEQRFGVAAKEKLKKLKTGVDVLTMSATPIPRTLHMSLGGLRDLSVIETPPRGRLSIQTTVAPFSQGLIQAAILQEMQRQGQVYFVHNRVESIFSIAALVQRLVPAARLGVSHGQMKERELEKVMIKFMQGEYDVLVSTALIENGLDIPRANTMIVNHADRFGLADLYQLRGRVGRSNRRAYAYFLIPAEESLTPTAKRRLAALKEFSDLGAGFRLAALDLELRGAGNVLGREQHGHLNAIGIDLYLKMLDQTVEELKGAPLQPEVHTTLNLGLDIKIPDRYIADESERLRMYKRISSLATPQARADLEAELVDRYGPIPPSVSNLLTYALLKSAAEEILVQSIERKAAEVWVRFHEQAPVDPGKLTQFVRLHREASFRPDGVLRFRLRDHDGNLLEQIQNALQELHPEH